eukprot:m.211939 g.211939  ORF g.211939 m.211939 type:complete len:205 (-) comp25783_c0_seq1:112-726(-)
MWALYLLSWVSWTLIVCFSILCIACGLYFLAEAVEESTVLTKTVLNHLVVACIVCNVIVGLVEPIPLWVTAVAVGAHLAYRQTMASFPELDAGPSFYGSCVLLLLHNIAAFQTFAETWFPYDEFLAYFVICVWLVPFGLFISLSVNDNVLPTHGGSSIPAASHVSSSSSQAPPYGKTTRSGLLVALDSALDGARNFAGDVAAAL